jgi:hypothetical protein
MGHMVTVGHIEDRPIVISLSYARIYGQRVVFWEATSQLIDHAMIEKWFEEHFAPINPGNHTDVMNFHHAISKCRKLAK